MLQFLAQGAKQRASDMRIYFFLDARVLLSKPEQEDVGEEE